MDGERVTGFALAHIPSPPGRAREGRLNPKRMRLVIKVGSNVLTRSDGKLDVTRMSALVDQVAALRAQGHEAILVSSGAVASGRGELKVCHKLDSVEQRQLFSAIGQVKLINLYYSLFRDYGIPRAANTSTSAPAWA